MNSKFPVALVTGGARRIGAAIVRSLHGAGYRVVIHYQHSAAEAAELASSLNSSQAATAQTLQADLLATESLAEIITEAQSHWGRLDLLVNNASSFYPTPVGKISHADWDDLLGTNLKAPLFLSQAATPALREAKGGIVNIVDIHAQRPMGDHPVYCAAKAGLAMLTRSLAKDLGPDIRVNAVAPGAILWPEAGLDESQQQALLNRTALKRQGQPEDIARTVLFLAQSDYITGEIIRVDGGRSLGW